MSQGRSCRYQVVDVFTRIPLEGNPLAVFPDAADLDAATMQRIARELSLSETVFIAPSRRDDCVARLRIFTPRRELDFAGHPTVGSAWVLSRQRNLGDGFAVEENVGAIPVVVDHGESPMLWLRTPAVREGPTVEKPEAAALIGLAPGELADAAPQILSAGNPNLFIALKEKSAVDRASLDGSKWAVLKRRLHPDPLCAFVFAPTPEGAYSRLFAPDHGIAEDPATGSATGPLAFYMVRHGMTSASRFVSEQGTQMGRRSFLHVRLEGDVIEVGGHVVPVIDGELHL